MSQITFPPANPHIIQTFEQLETHKGDEKERMQFVYSHLKSSTEEIAVNIHRFHITDQKALLDIALAIAKINALAISKNIGNFKLVDEEDRIKVFLRSDKTSEYTTSKHYSNYNISHAIFEAYIHCQHWIPAALDALKKKFFTSPYYQKLAYRKCKDWLNEKGGMSPDYSDALKLMKNVGTLEYDRRLKLAKRFLFSNGPMLDRLPKFNINIQELLPYLRDCAKKQPSFSYFFYIFEITDQDFLYELALLAAQNHSLHFTECISSFANRLSYEQLLALLEIVYENNAFQIASKMSELGFAPPERLCKKIALLSLSKRFYETLNSGIQFKWLIQTQPINSIEDAFFDFFIHSSKLTNYQNQEIVLLEEVNNIIKNSLFNFLKVSHHVEILTSRIEIVNERGKNLTKRVPLSGDQQITNLKWLIKTLFKILYMEGDKQQKGEIYIQILEKIVSINEFDLRNSLADWCYKIVNDAEALAYFLLLQNGRASHLTVPHLLCTYLKLNNADESKITVLAHTFYKLNKHFKDNSVRRNLFEFVVISENKLSYNTILDTFLKVFYDEEKITTKYEIKKRMQIIVNIANSSIDLIRSFLDNNQSYEMLLVHSFTTNLPIKNQDNFYAKFMQTFGTCRQPLAIFHYLAAVIRFNEQKCYASFAWFLESVLEDPTLKTFSKERIEKNNEHLDFIFKNYPELKAKWQIMEEYPLSELVQGDLQQNSHFVVSKHLINIIFEDKHIDLHKIDPGSANTIRALIDEIDSLTETEKIDRIASLRLALSPLADDFPIFFEDLHTTIKFIQAKPNTGSSTNSLVLITDNAYDLFLCGTEVTGSCQHTHSIGYLNKGLLGYIADGKIQLAAIKTSKEGAIQCRALLRLLHNSAGQPVLFLSRFYPANITNLQKAALIKICLIKAKKMNLPLLSSTVSKKSYEMSLVSDGCPAPHEYVDEAFGHNKLNNGSYKILNAYYIQDN